MADNTKIEWADATVNAINGCTRVSPGCGGPGPHGGCYAERLAATRLRNHPSRPGLAIMTINGPRWTGKVHLHEPELLKPLRWQKPRSIFWNAHGDIFHPAVLDEWIDSVFAVCALTPHHTHMILTKRSERMREYMTGGTIARQSAVWQAMYGYAKTAKAADVLDSWYGGPQPHQWPLPNVWLGVSVEDQTRADERIPDLLATPAAKRFLSCEPLLEAVSLAEWIEPAGLDTTLGLSNPGLDWVIVGGESGPRARPMHPDWPRAIRDQCANAGVPFFFKQWGEWEVALDRERDDPDCRADYSNNYVDHGKSKWLNLAGGCGFHGERFHVMRRVGKKDAGRLLDGVEHNGFPGIASEGQAVPEPLKRIIARVTHPVLSPSIEADTRLRDDLKLDDLDLQTIALDCDVEWGIEIRDLEWRGWVTPASVAATIEKHTGNRS